MDKNINILKRHLDKELIVFVGAGASISQPSALPSFFRLRDQILTELFVDLDNFHNYKALLKENDTKPELLLQTIWEYMKNDINPIEGFQYAPPNNNHRLITELCRKGVRAIITTNFDQCIERSLENENINYTVISGSPMNKDDHDNIQNSFQHLDKDKVFLWKPHGDIAFPESLCFTMEQVARLNNSNYLKSIYEYLFSEFNFIMLGYSGYDDDFFPLLYEYPLKEKRKRLIFWNSYMEIKEGTPPYRLKQNWKDNMRILVGDMEQLLSSVLEINPDNINIAKEDGKNWEYYLKQEINKISLDNKVTIIGKYMHSLQLKECVELWKFGLSLQNISKENELRFILNTCDYSDIKYIFEECLKYEYYNIASVALYNLIYFNLYYKDYSTAFKNLRHYKKKTISHPDFFEYSKYLILMSRYFDEKYRSNYVRTNKVYISLLEKVMKYLLEKGDIISFVSTYSKLVSHLAAANTATLKEFEGILKYLPILEPYGIHSELAGLYYSIAIIAHQIVSYEKAEYFLSLAEKETKLSYRIGIYNEMVYYELMSLILHERSAYGTALEAIDLTNEALSLLDQITTEEFISNDRSITEYKGIYYTTIANNYCILKEFEKAEIAALKSYDCALETNSVRGMGRALHALGDIYIETLRKDEGLKILLKSCELLNNVGENTNKLNNKIKKIKLIR